MSSVLLAAAFVFVWCCSYCANTDLFSPIKLYLLTLFVCFFDIFLNPYRLEISCIYIGLLLIPLVLAKLESQSASQYRMMIRAQNLVQPRGAPSSGRVVLLIWVLTVIPVAAMTYLVTLLGGLTSYLSQLAIRPLAFQGLNSFSEVAINLVSLLTVIYFGLGLMEKQKFGWWVLYSLHFGIAVSILSISGSRRSLLMPLIVMLATYHYFRAEISVKKAGALLALLLCITSIVGVLRMGQRGAAFWDRDLNEIERESVTAHFKYGLVPLEVVFDANVLTLHYGSTFIAAITNLVPRPIWPGKPDAAGLTITQDYLGNRWLGTSYLNAGFLAESIMNFGFVIGLTFSFAALTAAMAFLVHRYHRALYCLRLRSTPVVAILRLVRYFQIAFAITGLITWETAIVVLPLVLNLSAISVIEVMVRNRRADSF